MRPAKEYWCVLLAFSFTSAIRAETPVPDSLRSVPCVKDVELIGPSQSPRTIVQLRDWHFLPRNVFATSVRSANEDEISEDELDGLYEDFLLEVEQVQADQMAVLRHLIRHHGLKHAFSEGLSKGDIPIFHTKIRLMKKLEAELPGLRDDLAEAKRQMAECETDSDEYRAYKTLAVEIEALLHQHRLDVLRVGAAGRLLMAGEIAEVVPVEEDGPFEAANPVGKDGTVAIDLEKNEQREDAQVQDLLKGGPLVVVILGGAHDLADNIERLADEECRYVAVTTRAYAAFAPQ